MAELEQLRARAQSELQQALANAARHESTFRFVSFCLFLSCHTGHFTQRTRVMRQRYWRSVLVIGFMIKVHNPLLS
jgi:hypothetical protein